MPFITLPPEIRLKVYSNLLSSDLKDHNTYDNRAVDPNLPYNTSILYPSILRVSK